MYEPYIIEEREAKLKIPHYELSPEKLIEIETKLDLYLEEYKPFLKTSFSLAQLSSALDIPVHHFNFYFRKTQQSNFLEQRMRWRIRYAKELIDTGKDKVHTLEAIGFESGFTGFSGLSITSPVWVERLLLDGSFISKLFADALRIGEKHYKK